MKTHYLCINNISNMNTDNVAYWLEIAEYDLGTAEDLFRSKRWLYVAFMCHQAIEKTLKAYWCGTKDDAPPYVHDHVRLADGCGLYSKFTDSQKRFVALMRTMNIEARYPDYKKHLAQSLNEVACQDMINQTKLMLQWIKEQLSQVNRHLSLSADTNKQ